MAEPGSRKSFFWVFQAPSTLTPLFPSSLFFSTLFTSPVSSFLSSQSLSSPLPIPAFCFSQCREHSHCWPLSPEPGSRVQGPGCPPAKVPSVSKYLHCVCTQKLIHRFCQPIPTARLASGESGRYWPVLPATTAAPTMLPRGRLVAHTKHPSGHYHSGAEIHPGVHLIGHSAALNDLSVPCPAIFCLINSFIVHRIKQDKGLPGNNDSLKCSAFAGALGPAPARLLCSAACTPARPPAP